MEVAIIGLGAIGGWIAARLAAAGHEISGLTRGSRLSAIRDRGLILSDEAGTSAIPISVTDDIATTGMPDLLILATKAQSLPGLAPRLSALVGFGTIVLPLLNGVPWWFMGDEEPLRSVDPDGALAWAIPHPNIIGIVVHMWTPPWQGLFVWTGFDRLLSYVRPVCAAF